jgi:hypothetical protein
MANSVTRHALFSGPESWKYLACGVDTLDVSLAIDWGKAWHRLFDDLTKGKEEAAGTKGIAWGDNTWLIHAGGKPPMFRFHLQRPRFSLFIGKSQTAERVANGYASLGAELLWHEGVTGAVDALKASIAELGGRVRQVLPSRCDLCSDFLIAEGLSLEFLRAHRVPARSRIRLEEDGPNLQTVYVGGRKSSIQLRIYDKSEELGSKPGKEWLWAIWGIEPSPNVWRAEFQLRRPALKQLGINSIEDLTGRVSGVWKYLTDKWVSLRLHDNANATRRTIHPWWQSVAGCTEQFGGSIEVRRRYLRAAVPAEWFVTHVAGCVASFAARIGVTELGAALSELMELVYDAWKDRDFKAEYRARCIRLGIDPDARGTDQ